jgi:tetratricopeptide (TPR) repeat protein
MPALERLRRGDLAGARAAVEQALLHEPKSAPLLEFAALLAGQVRDEAAAMAFNRRLLAAAPANRAARINLATALLAAGDVDEAAAVAAPGGDLKLLRVLAFARHKQGRHDEAARAYEQVLAAAPQDFESWNNLGNVRAAQHDLKAAREAFQRAIMLRPDIPRMYLNLSEVLAGLEENELRAAVMREAARLAPDDPDILSELGLAESSIRNFEAAEAAFRAAIRLSAGFTQAYLELGLLLENRNRVEELAALVEEAQRRGVTEAELGFIHAWALRRQEKFEEALAAAEQTPESINPIRRAQLIAELTDRLGDGDRAFAQFTEMNRAALAAKGPLEGPSYRDEVNASVALLTQEWVASWNPVELEPVPPSPIFIVGFPRSGTTLLDTLLMNMPELHVLEEMPVLRQVQLALGQEERLASLAREEATALRRGYFEALEAISPPAQGQRVVDKYPLHMTHMPLIHRIFPDAKVIFVERHPCDSVLSCFMSNFQLNRGMRSFVDLEEAARTYDAVFEAWTRATELLPIDVHRIRYERMVEDLEGEMRPLLDFLDIPWDPKVLDNRGSAAKRDHIRTASYSQVTEPIYRRSAGRWERYRQHMAPVLPILAPWAERMGYPIEP